MSGSIGGKRIKREEVQPTLDNYINKVLSKFPGFVSAQITGSYNAGTRKDHGDIDLAVHIKGTDVKTVKKNFKNFLDSLDLPKFVMGNKKGEKSQLYGAIVTCGFPISGREEDYVQIDNIIVTNENEQKFQKKFLDLDAAKQGLIMGYIRTILHHKDTAKILNHIGLQDLPKLSGNQEYEFVLSSAGLSFRLVTLTAEMKESSREELWRSANWDIVEYILDPLDLSDSYEALLEKIGKIVRNDNRSKRRIVGIMKSMIRVGPGEVGTPKGDGKIKAIERAETVLKESNMMNLKDLVLESNLDLKKAIIDYIEKADDEALQDLLTTIKKKSLDPVVLKRYFSERGCEKAYKSIISIFSEHNSIDSLIDLMSGKNATSLNNILNNRNIYQAFRDMCDESTMRDLAGLEIGSGGNAVGKFEILINTFLTGAHKGGKGDVTVSSPDSSQPIEIEIKAGAFRLNGQNDIRVSNSENAFNDELIEYRNELGIIDGVAASKGTCQNIIKKVKDAVGDNLEVMYKAYAKFLVEKHESIDSNIKNAMFNDIVNHFKTSPKFDAELVLDTSIAVDLAFYQISEGWDYIMMYRGKGKGILDGNYVLIEKSELKKSIHDIHNNVKNVWRIYPVSPAISQKDKRQCTVQCLLR